MSVGGVGRGGGKGRAGGLKGPAGKAPAGKAGGAGFGGSVDRAAGLVGPSGLVGSSNVDTVGPTDPLTSQAKAISKQLKNGDFKNKDEATRKLVAEVLKEKLRMKSSALTAKIADALQDDPRLNQALERLWSKAE
jgi:Arc/MetJ-type ribon-helix-helix transcriptional regulator